MENKIRNRFSNNIYKNTFYIIGNTLFLSSSGFFFWIIASNFYSSQDVGYAIILISIIQTILIFSKCGLDISLISYIPRLDDKRTLINSAHLIGGVATILFSLVTILLLIIWGDSLFRDSTIILNEYIFFFLIIVSLANTLLVLQQSVFIGLNKMKCPLYLGLMSTTKIFILPIFVFLGYIGITIAYGIGIFLALSLSFLMLKKVYPKYSIIPKFSLNITKKIFHFSSGSYIARIFEDMPINLIPILIGALLNSENTAYFYISWSIFSGSLLVISRANSFVLLSSNSSEKQDSKENILRSLKFVFLLSFIIVVFLIIFGNNILMLFGNSYAKLGYNILVLLALSSFPFAINRLYIAIERAKLNYKTPLIITSIIGSSYVLFSIILMNNFGIEGIAYAWIISQSLPAIYCSYKLFNEIKN